MRVARDVDALANLATSLGPRFRPLATDVRDHDRIAAELADAQIDVLVNNAGGLATVQPLFLQTAEETAEVVALNLLAPLQLIRLFTPGMIARKKGHIFNLTSTAAGAVFPGTTSYGAAKAELSHAGCILRYDLAGTGVRLTEIAPGRAETEFYLRAFDGDRRGLHERMYTEQRALKPADIALILVSTLRLPPHVDIAELTVAPSEQAPGGHIYPAAPVE